MLHRRDPLGSRTGWLKPFLLYLAISLRLFFFHVPVTIVTRPMHWIWHSTGVRLTSLIPERLKVLLGALLVVGVMLIGGFASPESQDNTRDNRAVSLFGLAVIIFVMWATSRDRKKIKWHTVIVGYVFLNSQLLLPRGVQRFKTCPASQLLEDKSSSSSTPRWCENADPEITACWCNSLLRCSF